MARGTRRWPSWRIVVGAGAAAVVALLVAVVLITGSGPSRPARVSASAAAAVETAVPPTPAATATESAPPSSAVTTPPAAPTRASSAATSAKTAPTLPSATQPAVAAATAAPAAPPHVHSLTVIGDSWTYGQGATGLRGYAVLAAEQLGWQYHGLGVWGSGYTQVGGGSTFDQRVDQAVATHPDVLVIEGSLNERNTPVDTLAAAADSTLAHLRAAADPTTRILVMGAAYNPGTPNATIDSINATVRSAAARSGLQFVDPATGGWIDAGNPALWHDPDHPDDTGHQIVADHLEPLLRTLVGN